MSQFEFSPLPQSADFDKTFLEVDALVTRQGGLEVVAAGESDFSAVDELAFDQDMALAQYSTLTIPYDANRDLPSSYGPAHAFSRGFMMSKPVNDLLYAHQYSFNDYYSSLNQWMLAHDTDSIEDPHIWFETNAYILRKYGEGGLERIGPAALGVIERWGGVLFEAPYEAKVFGLGCGALVMSGLIHQNTINEYAIRADTFTDSLDDGLASLLSGDTEGEQ
ncbi:MAG: hypothetical protein ACO1N2_01730 [Candidatus Saccharimonadota bacterium]